MTKHTFTFLLPLFGYVTLPLAAERSENTQTPGAINLSEVVVSATRARENIASIPGSVQVIHAEQIRQQSMAGRRVSDIIGQLVPGLAPGTGGMSNFSQSLRGRGLLVLIDGVSQQSTRDNYRQLNSIAADSIERIEVVSGASSINGAGASGGTINIITKRNNGEALGFSSKVGVATGNTLRSGGVSYDVFQSATGQSGAWDGYFSAALSQRNDQFDGNGKRIAQDTSQGSNMDTKTYDLLARFGYALDATRALKLGLQDYKDQQHTRYIKDPKNLSEAVAVKGLDLEDQPYTHKQAINLSYTDNEFFAQDLQMEGYWRRSDALFFPAVRRGKAGFSDNNSVQDVYGLRAAIQSALPDIGRATGRVVWGADYDHERSRQRADQYMIDGLTYRKTGTTYELGPDLITTTQAIFAQASYELGDWTLRSGVRRTWIESDVSDSIAYGEIVRTGRWSTLPGETLKYDATLYNAGAVYRLDETQEVFANFSQGFSLPDIQRYLREVSSTYDISQLNAQALKVNSHELGWRATVDRWQSQITVYENTSDVTQFYDAQTRALRLINQKERVRGFEVDLQHRLTDALMTGGTYAWTKGETRQTGKWVDLPATRVSPAKTTVFAEYAPDRYSVRLQALHLGNYDAASKDNNGRKISGYTVFDLMGSTSLSVGRLEGGIYNLCNRQYYSLFSQATSRAPYAHAQGRTLGVSYALDF
ncbi:MULTISPECIES: TonB-dependent receptor [unclassified Pseudomonas]|uniref:TonB-dependent receptor n=1 Tax=unclassified Pseudomonas TaxID=196821 RepID=UPI000D38939B|nr:MULTISPECIES: TonB-dependent receptor [unclassified Pseudomonas]RAU45811.1 TonB-dependent receptor [Pseudomonas sp. RIT 409]RAU56090.1 TonB-dependent receptor [Pseudomonas sp. RIT 412]